MATKVKTSRPKVRPAPGPVTPEAFGSPWATPPATTEERLRCIEVLATRVTEHVRFVCAVEKMTGTSREAKDQAVTIFYNRLVTIERELNRIQDELRLG
jgi:hypothetical protein